MENIKTLVVNILKYYQNKEETLKARKTKKSFHTLDSFYSTHNGNFETLCREKWIVVRCRLNRNDIVVIFSILRYIYYNDFSHFQELEPGFDFLEEHEDYCTEFPKNTFYDNEEIKTKEENLYQRLVSELSSYEDISPWIKWIKMLNCEYVRSIKYHEDIPEGNLTGLIEQNVYSIETIIDMVRNV